MKKFLLLAALILSNTALADVNSTKWTSGTSGANQTNPATGTVVANGSPVNISLQYGAFGNGGLQFEAHWTSIANNLEPISPSLGMSIGYTNSGTVQTVTLSSPVTHPYLMFNYVDRTTCEFSAYGAANVRVVNATSTVGPSGLATLSNGIVTVNGANGADDGFAIELLGAYSTISFTVTLTGGVSPDTAGFTLAVDAPLATISGTVSGLESGKSVVLLNNGGNSTTVSANGNFSFSTSVATGSPYAVTVVTQPANQTCTVTNGSGTASGNVTNVAAVVAQLKQIVGVCSLTPSVSC